MKNFTLSRILFIWASVFLSQFSLLAQPVDEKKLFIEIIKPVNVKQDQKQVKPKIHDAPEPDFSPEIDETTAKKTALSFINSILDGSHLKSTIDLELSYKSVVPKALKNNSTKRAKEAVYYYIFSSSKANIFVIVSGDSRAFPILGYSNSSSFDPLNIPPNMRAWLNMYKNEIQYAIDKELRTSHEVKQQWLNLYNGENTNTSAIVAPMISTRWDQIPPYNSMCPYDNTLKESTLGGCTSTAMAQIMKYWEYPASGIGSNSYIPKSHPELGVISADFENTEYDWVSMPNTISAPNYEIGRLIFHCGVSTNMDYRVSSLGGSHSNPFYFNHPSVLLAFRKYFGYKHTNSFKAKFYYNTNDEWLSLIKAELDANRPVFYGADDDVEGGHNFVCDGYDNNNFLHFNWGWGGLADGYFTTEAIDLGYRDYTSKQDAIVGIEPLSINPGADIQFNSKVAVSPSVYLKEKQAFSVAADFKNFGATTFEGTIEADVYDLNGKWVSNINNSNNFTLHKGENTGTITFATDGISAMTPGTYFIAFWKKSTQTKLIASSLNENGYYQMFKMIVVSNSENPVAADEYENNNDENTAFEFTPEFNNNTAEIKINANIHEISDIDYYKIKLPSNYTYSINAKIVGDCQAALGYGVYSLDGKFSYKNEDGAWSETEDLITLFTQQGNDDYLYFKVEPSLAGYMGTYDFSVEIAREVNTVSSYMEFAESSIMIYPIPNGGNFTLKLGNDYLGDNRITISSLKGNVVSKLVLRNPSVISKQINMDVPPGIYLIQIKNNNKNTTKKIVVF